MGLHAQTRLPAELGTEKKSLQSVLSTGPVSQDTWNVGISAEQLTFAVFDQQGYTWVQCDVKNQEPKALLLTRGLLFQCSKPGGNLPR